jgi:hypothetical protein
LPLGNYIKIAWNLFKQYPFGFIGFTLVNFVIYAILRAIPFVGGIASFAVWSPLIMGNFIVSAKLLQRQAPIFRDFFAGVYFFVPLLLLSLISWIFISIGLILLLIPGVYLLVAYLFASPLLIDRRLNFWPAMELSRTTLNPLWFRFFAFGLLLLVINLAGAIPLCLSLLIIFGWVFPLFFFLSCLFLVISLSITIPFSMCALTAAYADVFGFQSDYSKEAHEITSV